MNRWIMQALGVFVLIGSISIAEETPVASADGPSGEQRDTGTSIDNWIRQLDSDSFTEREQADEALRAAGANAIPALSAAAQGKSPEAANRALEILKQHFESGDETLKTEARAALEQIANGENAKAARRAKAVLAPMPEPPVPARGLRIAPAQIRIQVQNLGVRNRRITTRIVNGVKTVEGNDGDRQFVIVDDPEHGITMKITTQKDGKEVTEKFAAANAEQLKKEHPEAFKLYEEFTRAQAQIQFKAVPVQGNPLRRAVIPAERGAGDLKSQQQARKAIEQAARQLSETTARLNDMAKQSDSPEEFQAAIRQLEAALKQLGTARNQLTP